MKKLLSLVLALALICGITAASADPVTIDGLSKRNIKYESAGLNPSADEMIAQMISPTTGRKLDEIYVPDNFTGVADNGIYQPAMVQISHNGGAVGVNSKGQPKLAPINGSYADIIYETYQGGDTRTTMVFSDLIPDYVGWVRSTRLTHCRIRQEWDCVFCTSGYSEADVPDEWRALGVKNPASPDRTADDPGLIYVGDFPKVWKDYVWRVSGISSANNEIFQLADIMRYVAPKDHVPANHTWLFSEELPAGGDTAEIVYVDFGSTKANSRYEYDPAINAYYRFEKNENGEDEKYQEQRLISPQLKKVDGEKRIVCEDRVFGDAITFNNVIIQGIVMNWRGEERPDPTLTGTGNADYFMGGKHYAGVWERTDINSRTVFYGEDGQEISLQPGRTLIIMMDYHNSARSVKYE